MKNRKSMGLVLGIGLGTAIGVATDNLAVWIGVGVALGVAIDSRRSRKS